MDNVLMDYALKDSVLTDSMLWVESEWWSQFRTNDYLQVYPPHKYHGYPMELCSVALLELEPDRRLSL